MGLVTLIHQLGLVPSKGEGFRTIEQGGLTLAGEKVTDAKRQITLSDMTEGQLLIQKGKKTFHLVQIQK